MATPVSPPMSPASQRKHFYLGQKRLAQLAAVPALKEIVSTFDRLKTQELVFSDFGLIFPLIDPSMKDEIIDMFTMVDIDGNGKLSVRELTLFKIFLMLTSNDPQAVSKTKRMIPLLFDVLDANANGKLEWSEVEGFARKFRRLGVMKKMFGGNTFVTKAEFLNQLEQEGFASDGEGDSKKNKEAKSTGSDKERAAEELRLGELTSADADTFSEIFAAFDRLKTKELEPFDFGILFGLVRRAHIHSSRTVRCPD
eukprot:TRINITY_DN3201_c0_g1_i1.p1 TRINITY_DN3201_c0_g1~~TRINITY_DN3201_c0_g1_i1.p1  ORF type:complete len:254 (-),score=69.39 TRINITY_DN3201_c0_g1_i1:421-1182(-)